VRATEVVDSAQALLLSWTEAETHRASVEMTY